MSINLKVDSAQISSSATRIQATAGQIEDEVRSMMSQLEALAGTWHGQASSNFQAATQDWRLLQQRVRESLDGIRQALAQAGAQYEQVEQSNASMFAR